MATVPSPKTWTNTTLPASDLNTHVRDAVNFLLNPPRCRVYNSAAVSIPNNADTIVTFNSERGDTDGMHSTSVNTGRITIITSGWYLLTGHISWAANATGQRVLKVRYNGATSYASQVHINLSANALDQSVATLVTASAGDYFELVAYQNSGGALNVSALGNYSPEFTALWVGTN